MDFQNPADNRIFLDTLLQSLSTIVILVDQDVRIREVGEFCRVYFNPSGLPMVGQLCGNGLGCESVAGSDRRCGTTPGCVDCGLRNSILKTFAREVPVKRATLHRSFGLGDRRVTGVFQFSTRLVELSEGPMVLILIDDVTERESRKEELEKLNRELLAKNTLLEQNLKMARQIQRELIPSPISSSTLFRVEGYYEPLEELGGDFYDFYVFSPERISFFLSDVSGHGISSALIATLQKPIISSYFKEEFTPGEVLTHLNHTIHHFLGNEGFFLTAVCGQIDFSSMTLDYSIAAHPDFILLKKDRTCHLLPNDRKDLLIGPFDRINYTTRSVPLEKGDTIFVYTDGIIETANPAGELFGKGRLMAVLLENCQLPPVGIIEKVRASIREFAEGVPPEDDLTMLVIELI